MTITDEMVERTKDEHCKAVRALGYTFGFEAGWNAAIKQFTEDNRAALEAVLNGKEER